jgi:hypothetical protein
MIPSGSVMVIDQVPVFVRGEKLHHRGLSGDADGTTGLAVALGQKRGHRLAAVALRGAVRDFGGGKDGGEAEGEGEHLLGHGRAFLAGNAERLPGLG